MRGKLMLNLEDLTVDSFDTTTPQKAKGTVFGEQCTCYTQCTCPGCPTCYASCNGTCGDTCAGFELWQANHRIASKMPFQGPPPFMSGRVEEAVIEREEKILESRSRIAQSKRLLDRITKLKGVPLSK